VRLRAILQVQVPLQGSVAALPQAPFSQHPQLAQPLPPASGQVSGLGH
jgi:hypothetical protein